MNPTSPLSTLAKQSGDPVINNLPALRYTDAGVEYQTDFDNNFSPIPQRNTATSNVTLKPMYTGRLPITQWKYNDLKALMDVVPQDTHSFYDNLSVK